MANSFLLFFPKCTPCFSYNDKHVACVCLCVPLPLLSWSRWFPALFLCLTERWCGDTVWPDEPEQAVLRRDSWAPIRPCLPAIPHATANPTTQLCHRLYRPAAPNRGVLRLWTFPFPTSSPTPTLTPGICATTSTCTGKHAFSHTCDLSLSCGILWLLCFHGEYCQVNLSCSSGPYWYSPPAGPGLSYSSIVQKVDVMKLTQRSTIQWGNISFSRLLVQSPHQHSPFHVISCSLHCPGNCRALEKQKACSWGIFNALLAAALEICSFLSYRFIAFSGANLVL